MAGLLGDQQPKIQAGLLGLSAPQKATIVDYGLALLSGGVSGAAALGLQQRQQGRRYAAQAQQLEGLLGQAKAAGWTPDELTTFGIDPAKALDLVAERVKPREITAGNTLDRGGQRFTAPKFTEDAGIYGTQTADGWQQTGQRSISHQEVETERHNMGTEELGKNTLAETGRHNRAAEGIGYGNLGVARGQLGVSQGQLALARQTAGNGGKATEGQATAGFNAGRMVNAAKTINSLETAGFNAGWGVFGSGPDTRVGGDKVRQYEQAENEWADALIRQTTGAAATKDEIALARKTYFPQFGDTVAVRNQKAASRQQAEQAAIARSGPAAPRPAAADPLGIR